jgi:fluoride exporter
MTPTAQHGGRNLSAAGRFFFALRHGEWIDGLSDCVISGGIGASLRHGFNLAFARLLGTAFPYATLSENVSGSIVMGLLVAIFAFRTGIPHHWQLFLTTGILGGYTTFSTFSLDVALLYECGQIGLAALYVLLSVVLSIGGLFAGLALVRNLA